MDKIETISHSLTIAIGYVEYLKKELQREIEDRTSCALEAVSKLKLIPCPFCGSKDIRYDEPHEVFNDGGSWIHEEVSCTDCGATVISPKNWNMRSYKPSHNATYCTKFGGQSQVIMGAPQP